MTFYDKKVSPRCEMRMACIVYYIKVCFCTPSASYIIYCICVQGLHNNNILLMFTQTHGEVFAYDNTSSITHVWSWEGALQ